MRLWRIGLLVILLANSFGLVLIYKKIADLETLFPTSQLTASIKTQSEIASQLANMQTLFSRSARLDLPDSVLGVSDLLPDKTANPNVSTNFILAKDANTPVQVYKEQADFSAHIGQLVNGYKYPYFAKINDWYLVGLTDDTTGWVKSQDVSQVP